MKVQVNNLSFAYLGSEVPVLRNANLSVSKGRSTVILGSSGCGKSTLLKIMAGILKISDSNVMNGTVTVGGHDVIASPEYFDEMKRSGKIGYMFQSPVLFDNMTVRENIALPTNILRSYNAVELDHLIDLVGLSEHQKKYPKELSGGMRTRTSLARLFSTKPELLLLDEPFSSLDIVRKSSLFKEFHKLNKLFDTTTVLVTHDIFEAMVFSDDLCLMNQTGSTTPYKVDNWEQHSKYEHVVKKHFSCFEEISNIMKSNA